MSRTGTFDQRLVVWLSLAQLITWGSVYYTFALVMGPVERELGLGRAESSLAFSLALLVEGLCGYPVGRWIDRGHERIVMTVGSLLVGLMLLAHGMIDRPWQFYAVWAGLGVGMAATLYTPVFAVVTRRFPDQFRRAIITMTFLGGLASTVFIPLGSWLIDTLGWRHALWVLAALQFGVCLPLHAWWLRHAPRGLAASGAAAEAQPVGAIVRSARFLLVGAFMVLMMSVFAAMPAHMVTMLRESGLPAAMAIVVPASIGALQVVGRLLLYFFEHHFDVHTANRVIPSLLPVALVLLMVAPGVHAAHPTAGLVVLMLFVTLYGMGNGMNTIVKGTAIAQYVDRHHVASLNGVLGIPLALSRAASPWLMGALWNAQTGYRNGLWLMLGASLLSLAALFMAQRIALGRHRAP